MNIVVLGRGKTGSLVADVAHERGHVVRALGSRDNAGAQGLTRNALAGDDVVVDFTTPAAVLQTREACAASGKPCSKARAHQVMAMTRLFSTPCPDR